MVRTRQRLLILVLVFAAFFAPLSASAQSTVETIVSDIDAYWAARFADAGLTYTSPRLVAVDSTIETGCGTLDPRFSPGAYCAADQTVYYSLLWAPNDDAGQLVWWTVLAHEWGHHIQWQVDTGISTVLESELQADCFAGAFLNYAGDAGIVSPMMLTLAMQLTQSAGDVFFLSPEGGAPHGNGAQRALAFMTGMNGTATDCGFPG